MGDFLKMEIIIRTIVVWLRVWIRVMWIEVFRDLKAADINIKMNIALGKGRGDRFPDSNMRMSLFDFKPDEPTDTFTLYATFNIKKLERAVPVLLVDDNNCATYNLTVLHSLVAYSIGLSESLLNFFDR